MSLLAELSGIPDSDDVDDNPVVLTLTDGIISEPVTQSFTISLENVNDPPLFTSSPVTEGTEDVAYTYSITASDPDAGAELATLGTSHFRDKKAS